MKRIVIVCGLIAGAIVAIMMVTTVALCYRNANFEGNMLLGYATMVLAFSLIFVGVKTTEIKLIMVSSALARLLRSDFIFL